MILQCPICNYKLSFPNKSNYPINCTCLYVQSSPNSAIYFSNDLLKSMYYVYKYSSKNESIEVCFKPLDNWMFIKQKPYQIIDKNVLLALTPNRLIKIVQYTQLLT